MALLGPAGGTDEARDYLREQIALTRLQKQNLIEQNDFELSHLRWRRFNDQMKGAMTIMLVAVGALIVVAITAAMWNASQADGIVVDALSVPPHFAQDGMGGDVIADDLTEKIGTIRNIANDNSLDNSKGVRNDHNDIKVEIPNTGVSLAEVWRYMRLWLGNERHLDGNLRLIGADKIALTVTLDGERAIRLEGPAGALDQMEQKAAERVFAAVNPVNYVLYLNATGRESEALAQAARATVLVATVPQRADTYSLWSYETRKVTGDIAMADARLRLGIAVDPKAASPRVEIVRDGIVTGHDEEALRTARALQNFKREDQISQQQGRGFTEILDEAAQERDLATGDFQHAASQACGYCSASNAALHRAEFAARGHDAARSRTLLEQGLAAGDAVATEADRARYFLDAAGGDWKAATADARVYVADLKAEAGDGVRLRALEVQTRAMPLLAYALARGGDVAAARAAIGGTPRDCYDCVRTRGLLEAAAKNWNGAAYWLAQTLKQGPSLPFGYSDWGAMLMAKGDLDGAIAKFESANKKGPHFADPLEMWGEALIAKNRSNLALAKFEEAAKDAPNWGRLHLKWGEALVWSGKREEARKQFAIAAKLDLTPSEKSQLARVSHG